MAPSAPAFLATWSIAMAAMMLPSEWPLLRLDYATARSSVRTVVLGAGYIAVWIALGGAVLLADRAVDGRVLGMHRATITAGVLGAAALYQLTPLKRRCPPCAARRSPASSTAGGTDSTARFTWGS